MHRPLSVPSYRRHKQSGQAIVTLRDSLSNRRDVLLGKYGTAESRQEPARVIAEWEAVLKEVPAEVKAHAEDAAGNVEKRPHVVVVRGAR